MRGISVFLVRSNYISDKEHKDIFSCRTQTRYPNEGKTIRMEKRVCRNAKLRHTLFSWVSMCKMQGAEIKDEGSVRKYMTKSEIDEQRSSLHIMTQRHLFLRYKVGDMKE